MGLETLITAASAVSAGAQLIGGFQASREASVQQDIARESARQAQIESEERAKAEERESEKLRSRQLVGFLKSGVLLEGTPLQVLEETERLGVEDVEAIRRGGAARAQQFERQGQIAAQTGRARLFSGIAGAGSAITRARRFS